MLKRTIGFFLTVALVSSPTGSIQVDAPTGETVTEAILETEAPSFNPMNLPEGLIPFPTLLAARKTDATARHGLVQTLSAVDIPQEEERPTYRVAKAEVTAYTLGYESTGKRPGDKLYGVTASGEKVKATDKAIAAPEAISFGTIIEIDGYGTAEVLDRGGAILTKKDGTLILDILLPTVDEARKWGRRKMDVKIYY